MKIYLKDQEKNFDRHLAELKTRQIMGYDRNLLTRKITTVDLDSSLSLEQLNLDFLISYRIFPKNIMSFKTEWDCLAREMRVGDTIVQQAYIPPFRSLSQKIIFGVRINEIINESKKKWFSYETLEGHVEKGISIFTIEEIERKLSFKIETFSTPGNFLTKLVGPLVSVPYQTFCTRAALRNVKRQIEN